MGTALTATQLFTLKWFVSGYVNFTSIKRQEIVGTVHFKFCKVEMTVISPLHRLTVWGRRGPGDARTNGPRGCQAQPLTTHTPPGHPPVCLLGGWALLAALPPAQAFAACLLAALLLQWLLGPPAGTRTMAASSFPLPHPLLFAYAGRTEWGCRPCPDCFSNNRFLPSSAFAAVCSGCIIALPPLSTCAAHILRLFDLPDGSKHEHRVTALSLTMMMAVQSVASDRETAVPSGHPPNVCPPRLSDTRDPFL